MKKMNFNPQLYICKQNSDKHMSVNLTDYNSNIYFYTNNITPFNDCENCIGNEIFGYKCDSPCESDTYHLSTSQILKKFDTIMKENSWLIKFTCPASNDKCPVCTKDCYFRHHKGDVYDYWVERIPLWNKAIPRPTLRVYNNEMVEVLTKSKISDED